MEIFLLIWVAVVASIVLIFMVKDMNKSSQPIIERRQSTKKSYHKRNYSDIPKK